MQHKVTEKKLENDITVLFIDVPGAKSFDLAIAINSGYRFSTKDDIDKYEIPHILEHLVFDGSQKYPTNDDLQGIFSLGGGESNGFTTPYHNVFAFHNRLRNAESILNASIDMVFHPRLEEKSFDEEYKVIENEITDGMGDFASNAMLYTSQQVIPDFPGSGDTQITRLPNVTYADIIPYHKKYYVTANTTIMIAADFQEIKKVTLEKIILKATHRVPKGRRLAFPRFDVAKAHPKSASFVSTHKSITDSVACAFFVREGAASRKEMLSLGLFGSIVTGMKSYSVNYKLRKQGLVYGVNFSATESTETYGFELDITTDNQKFSEVYAYILGGIRDLTDQGITDKQFEVAKRDLIESFEDATASPNDIIGWYLQDYLMDGALLPPKDYADIASSITQQEMLELARHIFTYENLYHTVFSGKPIQVSSSMELLAKEVLQNRREVTQELIESNSLTVSNADRRYLSTLYISLIALLIVFFVPMVVDWGEPSLTNVYVSNLEFPWNFIAPIYLGVLLVIPSVMRGRELRAFTFQLVLVFFAWALIFALFDSASFIEPYRSANTFVYTQAWLVSGLLLGTFLVTLVGIRKNISERLNKLRGGKTGK